MLHKNKKNLISYNKIVDQPLIVTVLQSYKGVFSQLLQDNIRYATIQKLPGPGVCNQHDLSQPTVLIPQTIEISQPISFIVRYISMFHYFNQETSRSIRKPIKPIFEQNVFIASITCTCMYSGEVRATLYSKPSLPLKQVPI